MIGDILHGLLRLRTRTRPVCRPHAVQTRRSPLCTNVFLQKAHLICRHKELIVPTVQDAQIVAMNPCHLDRLHTEILPDAM